ncbi:hypothetical protein DPEC_G00250460 [Dallia pectoralis]|uniref:Uncharacterized protein n=1 Tax=Dallia pectoralis TaxID=75939 RepID=A0ACC2FT86_DALPE|nr:hypothetical protein DPEC_G00250460 [Dallia pectoralis]
MKLCVSLMVLLFCCHVVIPESFEVHPVLNEAPTTGEAMGTCQPDMCDLLWRLRIMESRLTAAENQVKDLQRDNQGKNVAFSAGFGGAGYYGPFNTDITLVYPEVLTNFGNAYNAATGVFTAPVAGVYHFTIYHHSGASRRSDSMLYKNQDLIAFISALNTDGSYNGSNGVILHLVPGDVVYIRLKANSWIWDHQNHVSHDGAKGWCHFNGILLFAV